MFKKGEAVIYSPSWWEKYPVYHDQPLKKGMLVYFLTNIPNVPGHCIVIDENGIVHPMIHPGDLRKAEENEV